MKNYLVQLREVDREGRCTENKHLTGNITTSNPFLLKRKQVQHQKKWGTEYCVNSEEYTSKVMTLIPGAQCSMHFHKNKKEDFILVQGKMYIDIIDMRTGAQETIFLEEIGDSITLKPYVPHSFYCPEDQTYDTIFIECSTKDDPCDNYRFYPSKSKEDSNIR